MEGMACEIDGREFGVGDFHTLGIFVLIQFGSHGESGGRGGCRNQLNDGLKAAQWLAAPIECDKGKQAMFDFVPLAGAGWQMTDGDGNGEGISQLLQFYFP